jgi:hypothetical protein
MTPSGFFCDCRFPGSAAAINNRRAARRFRATRTKPAGVPAMSVARQFDGKSITVTDLRISALYELAATSTPPEVQAEVERRIAAGEIVSAAD